MMLNMIIFVRCLFLWLFTMILNMAISNLRLKPSRRRFICIVEMIFFCCDFYFIKLIIITNNILLIINLKLISLLIFSYNIFKFITDHFYLNKINIYIYIINMLGVTFLSAMYYYYCSNIRMLYYFITIFF